MPQILAERDRRHLQSVFEKMEGKARLVVFSEGPSRLVIPGERPCQYCRETVQLVQELASLTDKLEVEVVDRRLEAERLQEFGITMVPAIVVTDPAGSRRNVRYFGIPAGYEFGVLVEDIEDMAKGATRLSADVREQVRAIDVPVHLKVFVTPTCPYCPRAVRLAHQFAMENPNVTADAIEAMEFPELAARYNVYGVPKTVVNETGEIEGALPEARFLQEILAALAPAPEPKA